MEEEFEDDPHGHITSLGMISNKKSVITISSQTDFCFVFTKIYIL